MVPDGEIPSALRLSQPVDLHFIPVAMEMIGEDMAPLRNPVGFAADVPKFFPDFFPKILEVGIPALPLGLDVGVDDPIEGGLLFRLVGRAKDVKVFEDHGMPLSQGTTQDHTLYRNSLLRNEFLKINRSSDSVKNDEKVILDDHACGGIRLGRDVGQ